MAIDKNKILEKVKRNLSIGDNSSDDTLIQLIDSAIAYFKGKVMKYFWALETEIGTQAIVIYASDMWSVGGNYKFSDAHWNFESALFSLGLFETKEASGWVE